MDRQLKQTALPYRSRGEHFRRYYMRPCADRPLPDVQRCVGVGLGFMPAADTFEGGLVGPVLLVDAPTRATLARGIAGIDKSDRNPGSLRLVRVGDEATELGERPIASLARWSLRAVTRPRKSSRAMTASGAFSDRYKLLRYAVIGVSLELPLPSGEFLQSSLGAARSTRLEAAPAFGETSPDFLYAFASVGVAVAISSQRNDTKIDSKPVIGLEFIGLGNIAGRGEHPLAAHEAQIDLALALALAVGHQSPLMLTHRNRNGDPAFQRPDAHSIPANDEPNNATVVGLRGIGSKHRSDIAVGREGIRNLGDAPNGRLGREFESTPQFGVGQFMQVELPERLAVMPDTRQPSASLIAPHQRIHQAIRLRTGGEHLDRSNKLHLFRYREYIL
jgi:hypothetical protein